MYLIKLQILLSISATFFNFSKISYEFWRSLLTAFFVMFWAIWTIWWFDRNYFRSKALHCTFVVVLKGISDTEKFRESCRCLGSFIIAKVVMNCIWKLLYLQHHQGEQQWALWRLQIRLWTKCPFRDPLCTCPTSRHPSWCREQFQSNLRRRRKFGSHGKGKQLRNRWWNETNQPVS